MVALEGKGYISTLLHGAIYQKTDKVDAAE
jgi:hypothetical protein